VSKSEIIRITLVCLLAAPLAGIALWSIGHTASDLFDPCATWDSEPDRPVSVRIGPMTPVVRVLCTLSQKLGLLYGPLSYSAGC
jgi:hypothetical protein